MNRRPLVVCFAYLLVASPSAHAQDSIFDPFDSGPIEDLFAQWTAGTEGCEEGSLPWSLANGSLLVTQQDCVGCGDLVRQETVGWQNFEVSLRTRAPQGGPIRFAVDRTSATDYVEIILSDTPGDNALRVQTAQGEVLLIRGDSTWIDTSEWQDVDISVYGQRLEIEVSGLGTAIWNTNLPTPSDGTFAFLVPESTTCDAQYEVDRITLARPAPTITEVELTEGPLGAPSWLRVRLASAVTASVEPGGVALRNGLNTVAVPLPETTTFTISASNDVTTVTAEVTGSPGPPVIDAFYWSPRRILQGDPSMLGYRATAGDSVRINPGNLSFTDVADTLELFPEFSAIYTMTLYYGGEAVDLAYWNLEVDQLAITSVAASPPAVPSGDPVTLSWTTNAPGGTVEIHPGGIVRAGAMGTVVVNPTGTTTYTLTCRNGPYEVEATVDVSVEEPGSTLVGEFLPGFGRGGIAEVDFDDTVLSVHTIDDDLWAVGAFSSVDGQPAWGVARWDGVEWSVPSGLQLDAPVHVAAGYRGGVVVAGEFRQVNGQVGDLAWFDGSTWSAIDLDLVGPPFPFIMPFRTVETLAVDGDDLYVGGANLQTSSVESSQVVRYDGSTVTSLGSLTDVHDLVLFEGDLIAAGSFFRLTGLPGGDLVGPIARWNESAWSAMLPGDEYGIAHTFVHDGGLHTLGYFSGLGLAGLSRWTGVSWQQVMPPPSFYSSPNHATHFDGHWYITGTRRVDGDDEVGGIARWTGAAWEGLDGGTRLVESYPYATNFGRPDVYGNALVVPGRFATMGGMQVGNLAAWSADDHWLTDGASHLIRTAVEFDGTVVVVGDFVSIGGVDASGIARWNGAAFEELAGGVEGRVYAATVYQGDLIVGGTITAAGEGTNRVTVGNVARFDGTRWSRFGPDLIGSPVRAFAVDGDDLYVGGDFAGALGALSQRLIRWDGASWQMVGTGVNDGSVNALALLDGDLYVAGDFITVGGLPVGNAVRWNGTSFLPMQAGFDGPVEALTVHDGALLAGGSFTRSFEAPGPIHNLARWTGSSWESVDEFEPNGPVFGFAPDGDALILCGTFTEVGGVEAEGTARIDGPVVRAIGPIDGAVRTVARTGNDLVFGGEFSRAGSRDSKNVAIWRIDPAVGVKGGPQTAVRADAYLGNHPNPFNPRTTIRFQVNRAQTVRLRIVDVAGRSVRDEWIDASFAGTHEFVWNGRDTRGREVASGVYFALLRTDGATFRGKMTLLR